MVTPLSFEVRQHLSSVRFDLLLLEWMSEMIKAQEKYDNLVDPDQRKRFLECGTALEVSFYKQYLDNIYWKAQKIQEILKTSSTDVIPLDLLHAVEPFVAKCYEVSLGEGPTVEDRFKAAMKNLKTKSQIDGSMMSIIDARNMMELRSISVENNASFQKISPEDALKLLHQNIQEEGERVRKEQEVFWEVDDQNKDKWGLFGTHQERRKL